MARACPGAIVSARDVDVLDSTGTDALDVLPAGLRDLPRLHEVDSRQWMASCPAHDDRQPSLSISMTTDRILMKCHTGCTTDDVVNAAGLAMADLFLVKGKPKGRARVRARYVYEDATGRPCYAVCRLDREWKPKYFTEHLASDDTWRVDRGDYPPMLYRIPELLTHDPADEIYCTEGEKDADALVSIGLMATTVPSNSWGSADLTLIQGMTAIVLCDNDKAGIAFGHSRAATLRKAGLKVAEDDLWFPQVPGIPGADVADAVAWAKQQVGPESPDLVVEVIRTLRPVGEWGGERSLQERMEGFYAWVPYEVIPLGPLAEIVYLRLALLATGSNIAKATITAVAEDIALFSNGGQGRNLVADAFKALEAARIIEEVQRGKYRLLLLDDNGRRRAGAWTGA